MFTSRCNSGRLAHDELSSSGGTGAPNRTVCTKREHVALRGELGSVRMRLLEGVGTERVAAVFEVCIRKGRSGSCQGSAMGRESSNRRTVQACEAGPVATVPGQAGEPEQQIGELAPALPAVPGDADGRPSCAPPLLVSMPVGQMS